MTFLGITNAKGHRRSHPNISSTACWPAQKRKETQSEVGMRSYLYCGAKRRFFFYGWVGASQWAHNEGTRPSINLLVPWGGEGGGKGKGPLYLLDTFRNPERNMARMPFLTTDDHQTLYRRTRAHNNLIFRPIPYSFRRVVRRPSIQSSKVVVLSSLVVEQIGTRRAIHFQQLSMSSWVQLHEKQKKRDEV